MLIRINQLLERPKTFEISYYDAVTSTQKKAIVSKSVLPWPVLGQMYDLVADIITPILPGVIVAQKGFDGYSQRPSTGTIGETFFNAETGNAHKWTAFGWAVLGSHIDVRDYGAINGTDCTAAFQQAAALLGATQNRLFVPDGTYTISGDGFKMPTGSHLEFESNNTILKYTGNTQCILYDGVYRVSLSRGRVDLISAGNDAIAINCTGVWTFWFDNFSVVAKDNSNQIGINLETHTKSGYGFGNYCGNIKTYSFWGKAGYGIKGKATIPNDPNGVVEVTNLIIDGGWIQNAKHPIYLENTATCRIIGIVAAGNPLAAGQAGSDGWTQSCVTIIESYDIVLMVGETGPCARYNIEILGLAHNIYDFGTSSPNPGALGYTNSESILMSGVKAGQLGLVPYDNAAHYRAIMRSNLDYANPFELLVQGGTDLTAKLLQYSETAGTRMGNAYMAEQLTLRHVPGDASKADTLIKGIREYANNAAAIAGGLAINGLYRTGDSLKIVH